MDPDHEQMVGCYVSIAQRTWDDEDFKRRLANSPREALAEEGWILPEGTSVEVRFLADREIAGQPAVEEVVAAWLRGIESGELRIAIFDQQPEIRTAELSEDDLGTVSGGMMIGVPTGFTIPDV